MNDRDTQDVSPNAARARVGMFDRAVLTPDRELDDKLSRAAATRALMRMTAEERRVLIAAIRDDLKEKMGERERRILFFIERIAAFCLVPCPCPVKVMGMAYALDLAPHLGLSMSAMARRMGVSRASISNAAWSFARSNNLEPSRWMRSEETTRRSRKAREGVCGAEKRSGGDKEKRGGGEEEKRSKKN